jgi:hypothetical protein
MAILFGNTRFWVVFANVFVVAHVGNCAVVCASQMPLTIGALDRLFTFASCYRYAATEDLCD